MRYVNDLSCRRECKEGEVTKNVMVAVLVISS